MILDFSELEGKNFTCVDGCALCCLCQPELSDDEYEVFSRDRSLLQGLSREHINGMVSEKATAIKLQGGFGACHFLNGRRCTVYEMRPRFCRQFPVHFHSLRKVQAYANLSCRGIANAANAANTGSPLRAYAQSLASSLPETIAEQELATTIKRADDFEDNCVKAGVHQKQESIVSAARRVLPLIAREDGIGKILSFAGDEPALSGVPAEKIPSLVDSAEIPETLAEMANETNYEQFNVKSPALLPVYADERLRWNVIRSGAGAIEWLILEENGSLKTRKRIGKNDVGLLPRDRQALAEFAEYAGMLTGRDQFYGYACYVCADEGYVNDMTTVYLGVLGTAMLDLWWRTSLIGILSGAKAIDRRLAAEGIRAFDMDCLDAPTIGAFF